MFYCNECAEKKGWEKNTVFKSYGNCEVCGKTTTCNDKPSGYLSKKKED